MSAVRSVLAVVAFLPLLVVVREQPATQPMQSEIKREFARRADAMSKPTEQHKALAAFVGEFDERTVVHMGPGEPMRAHAIESGKWVMGGRFVEAHSESAPDEDIKGDRLNIYGYDPVAKKYTLVGIESISLTAFNALGDYDPAKRTFTFDGTRKEANGIEMPFRWIVKVVENGTLEQQILMKPPGADQFVPVVNITHTPTAKEK